MTKPDFTKLSRRERQIMDIIFELETASAQQVLEHIPDAPSYSAMRALIARLVEKGLLNYRTENKRHIYYATTPQSNVKESALKRLIKTFFKGSKSNAISALLDMDDIELSVREIEDIERKIARIKQAENSKE